MYIDKLNDMVNEYNNTYHRTIKMKPIEVKDNTYIDSIEEVNDKILSLKLVIILKYQKKKEEKTFLLKDILQIDLTHLF